MPETDLRPDLDRYVPRWLCNKLPWLPFCPGSDRQARRVTWRVTADSTDDEYADSESGTLTVHPRGPPDDPPGRR